MEYDSAMVNGLEYTRPSARVDYRKFLTKYKPSNWEEKVVLIRGYDFFVNVEVDSLNVLIRGAEEARRLKKGKDTTSHIIERIVGMLDMISPHNSVVRYNRNAMAVLLLSYNYSDVFTAMVSTDEEIPRNIRYLFWVQKATTAQGEIERIGYFKKARINAVGFWENKFIDDVKKKLYGPITRDTANVQVDLNNLTIQEAELLAKNSEPTNKEVEIAILKYSAYGTKTGRVMDIVRSKIFREFNDEPLLMRVGSGGNVNIYKAFYAVNTHAEDKAKNELIELIDLQIARGEDKLRFGWLSLGGSVLFLVFAIIKFRRGGKKNLTNLKSSLESMKALERNYKERVRQITKGE